MSSQLSIKITTTGDLTERNISFRPNMVFIKDSSTTIYFPPTVKITNSLISKAVPEAGTPLSVFTSLSYFTKFMKYATSKRRFKPISLEQAEKQGITKDNFNFFKDIFFKRNNRIFIGGKAYSIISSKLDLETSSIPKNKTNLNFVMSVKLNIINKKNDTYLNRTKLSCKVARQDINDQWEQFFGEPFFDDGLPSSKKISQKAPVMYTSDMGIAEGTAPSKYRKVTPLIPPYIQPGLINPYQPNINPRGYMPAGQNPFFPTAIAKPIAERGTQTGGKKRNKTKRRKKKIKGTRKINKRHR